MNRSLLYIYFDDVILLNGYSTATGLPSMLDGQISHEYSSTKKVINICPSKREGKIVLERVVKYLGITDDEVN